MRGCVRDSLFFIEGRVILLSNKELLPINYYRDNLLFWATAIIAWLAIIRGGGGGLRRQVRLQRKEILHEFCVCKVNLIRLQPTRMQICFRIYLRFQYSAFNHATLWIYKAFYLCQNKSIVDLLFFLTLSKHLLYVKRNIRFVPNPFSSKIIKLVPIL